MANYYKEIYSKIFGPKVTTQVNLVLNRLDWPIIVLFYYKEKINPMYDALTILDFREAGFNTTNCMEHVRALCVSEWPILSKEDPMLDRVKYRLTPIGKAMAKSMWNIIDFFYKLENGVSLNEYTDKIRNMVKLDTEPTAIDVEEEIIKKADEARAKERERIEAESERAIEDMKRNIGISGSKINLDDIKVDTVDT